MKKVHTHCFVAGQSGGHIIPCITLAQEILTKRPHDRILFFTTYAPLDAQLTQSLDAPFTKVKLPVTSINNQNPFTLVLFVIKLAAAFFVSFYHLGCIRPQSITSTGGICTIPVALAAYILRIPIDLYELNVLPGKTTSFLAPLTRTIYCCFARTIDFLDFLSARTCTQIGYPIRFFNEEQHSRADAYRRLNLDPDKKTILILGGSQGSVFINNMIKQWISATTDTGTLQIIHQTGAHDPTDWFLLYKQHNIQAVVFPFNNNMEQCYAAADLIICRSGAGTLFEVLYFHKPCITIPLELQNNSHQMHNAFTIAQEYPELFLVLTQDTITAQPSLLATTIGQVLAVQSPFGKKHTQKPASQNQMTTA